MLSLDRPKERLEAILEIGDDWEDEWDVEEDFDANDSEEESEGFDYYYSDGKPYYLPSQP